MPNQTSNTNFLRAISLIRGATPTANPLNLPSITKTGNTWSAEYTQLTVPISAGERVSWTVLPGSTDYYFSITKTASISSNVRVCIFDGSGISGSLLGAFNGSASSTNFSFQTRPGQTVTFVAQINASGLAVAETFEVNVIPAIAMSQNIPTTGQIAYFSHSNGTNGQFWARGLKDSYTLRKPSTANVQVFTSNGTWTKPDNVTWVRVFMVGGGQGGGRGATGTTVGTKAGGAGGGGGAVISYYSVLASGLAATESIVVGAGGSGAAGTNANDQVTLAGSEGGFSRFGSSSLAIQVTAYGGNSASTIVGDFAPAGQTMTSAPPATTRLLALNTSSGGAGASLVGTTPAAGSSPAYVGVASTGLNTYGGQGYSSGIPFMGSNTVNAIVPSGATSESTQLQGIDGRGGLGFNSMIPFGGSGGSGGGIKSDLTYSGNGGKGGLYGGGGGGGAAALNGTTSGSGGDGAPGIVVVMAW
jgi:hypothetical protein